MRTVELKRLTSETSIALTLNLDGSGKSNIDTGCGFLDHMLTLFAKHSRVDLDIKCKGDTHIDDHHTVEDIGIVLGEAFSKALSDKKGILRYGNFILPMDEALILTAVDLSGRDCLSYDVSIPSQKVGSFDTELVEEFWVSFARNAKCNLHIKQLSGTNSHHIIEGIFKSCAKSLREAITIDKDYIDDIPSTKGVL